MAFLHAWPAAASSLLPADEAFRFAARPVDSRTIEARFAIADGYYLYRDKVKFVTEPVLASAEPSLPAGEMKEDPFFGRVQTYRHELLVRIPLERAVPGASVLLKAESQGCADAGVCYPVTVQAVAVTLPAQGAPAGPFVEATPARKRWFQ